MSLPRLAGPLALSLTLHLGLGWMFLPHGAEFLAGRAKQVMLTVILPARDLPAAAQVSPPSVAPPPAAALPPATPPHAAASAADPAGAVTQKARFLAAPDLTALEEIPVPFSGSLTLRLYVTALGTVARVAVIKSDPLPQELLDGLLARFAQARLAPALAGAEPVASTLELVIRYETGPTPLPRAP